MLHNSNEKANGLSYVQNNEEKKNHNIQQPNSTTELNVQAPTDFGETDTECSKTKQV